jgi:nucleoid-associated protein YgaU
MRYQFTPTEKTFNGKNVYRTTYYPSIPESYDDFYITASETDYLDSIAKKYYGDENLWWIIAKANKLSGYQLSVGVNRQLRIPANPANILNMLKTIN